LYRIHHPTNKSSLVFLTFIALIENFLEHDKDSSRNKGLYSLCEGHATNSQ